MSNSWVAQKRFIEVLGRRMAYVEHAYGEKAIVGHFKDGTHILWRDLNLTGISHITVRAGRQFHTALRAQGAKTERTAIPVEAGIGHPPRPESSGAVAASLQPGAKPD